MIALDTNILVHARRAEAPHHAAASRLLRQLAEGPKPWALAWPCVYEFLRVVTQLVMLGEGPAHAGLLERTVHEGRATGNLVYDAHIAALALEHGVRELWTTDRDFARFPGLRVRNPFLDADQARERQGRTVTCGARGGRQRRAGSARSA
jgi:predicted nucleic acid-binding protein